MLVRRIVALAVVACAACSAAAPGPALDGDRVRAHVAALTAVGPRPADSVTSRAAATYIRDALPGIPLEATPVGDVTLPAIEVLGTTFRSERRVHVDDPDLVARFGPPGKAVLVMAHYDTVPASPGAVDDAAAVAVLLELALELRRHPPEQPVMIAFTADEEGGLVGAEALAARHGDEVELAIALDLVGGSGALALNGASTRIGLAELTWLADAADRAGVTVTAPLPHRVVSRWWPQAERADHGVFTRRGIRAFHLYNRGQDGLWIDRAYHSPRDTLGRVDRASLDELGRLLRALVAVAPPLPAGDGFWLPVATNTVVPRWWLLALEIVLAAIAGLRLVGLALGAASRASPTRGAGVLLGLGCFALALGVAVAVTYLGDGALVIEPTRATLAPIARAVIGNMLVIAGVLGLASRVVARRIRWTGEARYLALALVPQVVIGIALMALGAAELAWIWLVPAAALALAPQVPRSLAPVLVATSALPALLVLWPNQILEAAWNGFWVPGVPLAVWVAALGGPALAAAAWWWRARPAHGPLGTLVLFVGCGVSATTGLALLLNVVLGGNL